MRGSVSARLVVSVAAGALLWALAGSAGEGADDRVSRLEERVRSLEQELRQRDAELARLREELEELRNEPPEETPPPRGPRWRLPDPDEWNERVDDMLERMRKELEEWGMDWGLPGREIRPPRGPRHLEPFGRAPAPPGSAYLGIEMEPAGEGVSIRSVIPGSPAEKAGFLAGDVIVEVAGAKVTQPADVVRRVGEKRPGDKLTVTVLRAGKREKLEAVLGSRPGAGFVPWPRFGRSAPATREAADGTIEVEVEIPGGRASVSFSAPGLYLSDELAGRLALTEAEREAVEKAFARAREELARGLSREVKKGEGSVDAGEVARRRLAAEKKALDELKGALPADKLAALEKAQAELAARSQVSVSVTRSSVQPAEKGKEKAGGSRKRALPGTEDEPQEF